MDYIQKLICVILIFTTISILGFRYKRQREIRQKIEKVQLNEDAKRYFVTICHKLLTPFGDEKTAREYITFRIYGEHFFVLKMTKEYQCEPELEILMNAVFKGVAIVDEQTYKEYSYNAFERHLNNLIGDSLVFDFYIKHLWNEMQKSDSSQTT